MEKFLWSHDDYTVPFCFFKMPDIMRNNQDLDDAGSLSNDNMSFLPVLQPLQEVVQDAFCTLPSETTSCKATFSSLTLLMLL